MILLPNFQYIVKGIPLFPKGVECNGGCEILTIIGIDLEANIHIFHRARDL
jgi:hypothetical protein